MGEGGVSRQEQRPERSVGTCQIGYQKNRHSRQRKHKYSSLLAAAWLRVSSGGGAEKPGGGYREVSPSPTQSLLGYSTHSPFGFLL